MTKKEKMRLLRRHIYHDSLSCRLFYKDPGYEYYQSNPECKFEIDSLDDGQSGYSYVFFLDNVGNKEDLVLGLTELRPFADDALEIARDMTDQDFADFKRKLALERRGEDSAMSTAHRIIVLPSQIFRAMMMADKARAPVGTALVRMLEVELGV